MLLLHSVLDVEHLVSQLGEKVLQEQLFLENSVSQRLFLLQALLCIYKLLLIFAQFLAGFLQFAIHLLDFIVFDFDLSLQQIALRALIAKLIEQLQLFLLECINFFVKITLRFFD